MVKCEKLLPFDLVLDVVLPFLKLEPNPKGARCYERIENNEKNRRANREKEIISPIEEMSIDVRKSVVQGKIVVSKEKEV